MYHTTEKERSGNRVCAPEVCAPIWSRVFLSRIEKMHVLICVMTKQPFHGFQERGGCHKKTEK